MRLSCFAWVMAAWTTIGCDPAPKAAKQPEQVPANSLDDDRLHGTQKDKSPSAADDDANDPTQPYVQSVNDPSDPSAPAGGGAAGKGSKPPPKGTGGTPPSGGQGTVSKAECDKTFDRYISLEIASNPALKSASPDMIEQAKQMAKQQKGDEPCTATRAQYTCAMAAKTTAAWQTCMK